MKTKWIFAIYICLSLIFFSNCSENTSDDTHICIAGEWEIQTQPTCVNEGLNVKKCTNCKKIVETEATPVIQHTFGSIDRELRENDLGCDDYVSSQTCQNCGFVDIIKSVKIHDYETITKYSTCSELGYDTSTCRTCGDVKIKQHAYLAPHVYLEEYLSDGNFHWHKCRNCDNLSDPIEHTEDESGICTYCETKVAYTDGVVYELSEDESYAIVTGYNGSNRRVRIMPEFEGVPVTHIGKAAFQNGRKLYSISLTDNITHIEDEAFDDCPYLARAFHIGNVKYIGKDAFRRNFILDISVLPENLEYIGDNAFSECGGITLSVIPESVTYMGSGAFYHCNRLKSIKIGNSLTEIKDNTFDSCYNLGEVEFGEQLTSIGSSAFKNCYYIESLLFPDNLVSIGEGSFTHCNRLVTVYLGKRFETIGHRSFNDCFLLENINVHEENQHFKSIDGVVYTKDLSSLVCYPSGRTDENLTIPEGVKTIMDYAFYGKSYLKNLTLPSTLTDIGIGAFRDCESLESLNILGETRIGDYAFSGCSKLWDLKLSERVSTIGEFAFQDGGFVELVIPDSITSMGRWAFTSCYNLKKLTIGAGLKNIPEGAFIYCGSYLEEVIISEGVETIGENAFAYCYDLESISIPKSLSALGKSAFAQCGKLTYVYYKGDSQDWDKIIIEGQNADLLQPYKRYYYAESNPGVEGKYWHYDESGNIVIWR